MERERISMTCKDVEMKKLIFIVPVQLKEEGTLSIKKMSGLRLIVGFLKESFEITLLVRSCRNKRIPVLSDLGVPVVYDSSTPEYRTDISHYASRFQGSYLRWAGREIEQGYEVFRSAYDYLIAWDGCSPWCLATALRLTNTKRHVVWLHDDPNLYLMQTDRSFYANVCDNFAAIIASDDGIKNELDGIFHITQMETLKNRCTVLTLPVDTPWYWEQSIQSCEYELQAEELNLVAVPGMSRESALERLPKFLSEHQEHRPPLHCYLIGDGERLDRYIQQIAIYSVDHLITLVGQVDNPYPYVRSCDALLVSEPERHPELEIAAQVFEVPVLLFEKMEQRLPGLKKKEKSDRIPE
ncbi:MAG: hypothetical protein LUI10_03370 [Lachnospiraceae bacterium]|nr:hypothetical protein [Lachnospiraceae bacterium]